MSCFSNFYRPQFDDIPPKRIHNPVVHIPIFAPVESKAKTLSDARELYSAYLKKKKMFFTKERTHLLDFIFAQDGHFSADELVFEMKKQEVKVSRATLYRSLNQMVEAGILSESDFGHGHTHYEISLGSKPHVHLICTDTGDVKEVNSPKLDEVLTALARKEGFRINRYKIQLFGLSKQSKI